MDDLVAVTMSRIRNDITLIKTSNFNRLGPCKEKSSFDLTPFSSHVQCIPRARLGGGGGGYSLCWTIREGSARKGYIFLGRRYTKKGFHELEYR